VRGVDVLPSRCVADAVRLMMLSLAATCPASPLRVPVEADGDTGLVSLQAVTSESTSTGIQPVVATVDRPRIGNMNMNHSGT
jgi:hypothetical protein